MRTRVKGRCQLKLTTLEGSTLMRAQVVRDPPASGSLLATSGAAKVCFLKENKGARMREVHFCSKDSLTQIAVSSKQFCEKLEINVFALERCLRRCWNGA